MKLKSILFFFALCAGVATQAQTADEIIKKYFENTGGEAKWRELEGIRKKSNFKMQGMELPMESVQMRDGKTYSTMTFQGMSFANGFDGTTLWSTNQMTMKPEKSDAESTENYKVTAAADFPDPFLDYQKKGYKIELLGKETVEGTETFKIKLTKKPIKVDGKETENASIYYFDAENYVPLVVETEIPSGPAKGMISQSKMSDYQEVDGLMMPFSMTSGVKGQPGTMTVNTTSVEFNPKVDSKLYAFPSGN